MDWKCGSSGRTLALQVKALSSNTSPTKIRGKKKKNLSKFKINKLSTSGNKLWVLDWK
jgi:hypothetical protein